MSTRQAAPSRRADEARAAAARCSRSLAAGCGKVSEVREPDVFAGEGIKPAPAADRGADRLGQHPDRGRHARRGRQRVLGDRQERRRRRRAPDDRLGLLPLAGHLQRRPHEGPDLRGGRLASRTASSSRSPTRPIAPAIRRAERAGIPVVSINSGANLWRDLGVLAHVGQRETPAGFQVGKRMAAAGVKRAICVKQELRNNALDQRCAGFARGMRAGGATREQLRPRRAPTATSPRPSCGPSSRRARPTAS